MDLLASSSPTQSSSISRSRRSSWAAYIQNSEDTFEDGEKDDSLLQAGSSLDLTAKLVDLHVQTVQVSAEIDAINTESPQTTPIERSKDALQTANDHNQEETPQSTCHEEQKIHRPFQKWMRTIHRRARQQAPPPTSSTKVTKQLSIPEMNSPPAIWRRSHHRKSSSGSSFAFVSAVRSASVSLASVSAMTRSRRNTVRSNCLPPTERSSRTSVSAPRLSEDSVILEHQSFVDAAALDRSFRRRKVLEELISTEEAYIGDVRFLMNVYVTILAAIPSICVGLRSSINRNLTEIVELHEEILGELHRVVPDSEYNQIDTGVPLTIPPTQNYLRSHSHRRWSSLGAVPENGVRIDWLQSAPGMLSEPQVAAEVSKIFGKKMNRFFVYEEYGATYEMMIKDIASAQQVIPDWETYQKGLETLAVTLGSVKANEEGPRKALTTNDLLVKPIQRICKYPLLFAELLKSTPVADCPNSHMEVDSTLTRLREATTEINRASDDIRMKVTLEKTWLLQDRLVFPDRKLDAFSKKQIRSFGHLRLCGTLHVCWQTDDGVEGQYLICLLYRNVLCLASACKVEPVYTILACISVNEINIEEVDNGRGLQCHTAPFSWKLVFECDHQLYELIMTACTPKEEMEWRARLTRIIKDGQQFCEPNTFSSVFLNIRSLGTVFGKPGTAARRLSIHRATTVGPKSPLCQVVLKNTSVVRDVQSNSSATLTINRSQSLLTTTARVPTLAPPRSERARIEALLSDVWSREVLPFPGMTARSRSEHLVRSSASTVIRKLSVASFTSSFSKKSGSIAQRTRSSENMIHGDTPKRRDVSSSFEVASDYVSLGREEARQVKRQRIAKDEARARAPTVTIEISGTVRRRVPRETVARDIQGVDSVQSLSTRATSRTILLPKRSSSSKATYLSSKDIGRISDVSAEKGRSLNPWPKTGSSRNEGIGGFKKLFSIGREF